MKTLIATRADDIHAAYVKLALEAYGHQADLWYTADFPTRTTHSFNISRNTFKWNMDNDYDVIWYRRVNTPHLPIFLHPDDIANAKKENNMFFLSMWQAILPHARWINPFNNAARANSKILQLKVADSVNLNIPKTLISNNPTDIKRFIDKHDSIYKTLYQMAWVDDKSIQLTYANKITSGELPADHILQSTPGIFQMRIEKAYELRITYFGTQYIAVKIHSQQHEKAKADWRAAPAHQLKLEQVNLPPAIDQACQQLMQQLGIVFSCFDFIVTPENEYYFLEVNEQGQFLWIEEINPTIKMLNGFINFLINSNKAHNNDNNSLSLGDFRTAATALIEQAKLNHINPPIW